MRSSPFVLRFLLALALFLSLGNLCRAQFKATVQGSVTDPQGAAVGGAAIKVEDQATGTSRDTVASATGFYRVAELGPGLYTVTVQATGFKLAVLKDVRVEAEQPRGLDIVLQLGTVSEQVTVTAGAQVLQTESATISSTISSDDIQRLPQNGRDPYELLRFTPGVFGDSSRGGNGGANNLPNSTGPGGSNSSIFQIENSVQVVANGQRQDANVFSIDGVSVNSLQYGGAAVITPNQDSVQEISVLSNTYSAEDGRGSGAQVKVVTKGGSNDLHGTGFFKYQDPNWNAYNKYGGPNDAPPVRVNNNYRQFGGSIGGPIKKDKLFFFFSYEGARQHGLDVSSPTWVETPQYRQLIVQDRPGSIAAAIMNSAGIVPRIASVLTPTCALASLDSTQCQSVAGGLDIGSPTGAVGQYVSIGNPTGGGFDGVPDIEYVTLNLPGQFSGNQYNGRIDLDLNDKNRFSYSAYYTTVNSTTADSGGRSRPQGDLNIQPINQVHAFSFIHSFSPTVVNEYRMNFTRFDFNQIATSQNVNFGIPRIEIEGYSFDRIRFGAPQASTTPAEFIENTYDFRDVISTIKGSQAFKVGFEFSPEQNNNNLSGMARPLYVMHNIWNFPNDTPIFEQIDANPQTGGPANAQRYLRSKDISFFVQDDWRARPNLTLNFGLRWEYFTPLSDAKNGLTNLQFPADGTLANASVHPVSNLIGRTMRDAGPRFGFAWSPNRFKETTVMRGGFGLVFSPPDDILFANAAFNPPNYARFGLCCGTSPLDFGTPFAGGSILYALGTSNAYNSYPANPALAFGIDPATGGVCGNTACTSDQAVEIYGAPHNYRDAYVYIYSYELQRSLPWGLIATLGYQGSVSHKLTRLVNQNFLQQPSNSFYAVYFPTSDVNANYNALNARLRRAFRNGFSFDFQYRYSKSIDQLSNEGPGANTNQTDPAHPETEHGPSDFDAKHYLNFFALYDLPFFKDHSKWTGKLLGGWELNGILTWHTGFPWTPVTGYINSVPITNAATINPTRPSKVYTFPGTDTSNSSFINPLSNVPGMLFAGQTISVNGADVTVQCSNSSPATRPGWPYFNICDPGTPGIGRNSLRGPSYFDVDTSLAKRFYLPSTKIFGENASIELRGNFFNLFNKLNLQPFTFGTDNTHIENKLFGLSPGGLAGRVIEFQARFSF
jgi:hypothetical protein